MPRYLSHAHLNVVAITARPDGYEGAKLKNAAFCKGTVLTNVKTADANGTMLRNKPALNILNRFWASQTGLGGSVHIITSFNFKVFSCSFEDVDF